MEYGHCVLQMLREREVALQELVTQETLEVPKAERHGQTETATCGDGDSLTRRVGTGTAFMNSTTRKGQQAQDE